MPLSAIVKLLFDEGDGPSPLQGMVADISLTGIVLYLGKPLEGGAEVTLEILFHVSGGEVKSETVKGTTIYSNRIQNVYFVGIEFNQELNPKLQPALYSRIQNILQLS